MCQNPEFSPTSRLGFGFLCSRPVLIQCSCGTQGQRAGKRAWRENAIRTLFGTLLLFAQEVLLSQDA